MIHLFLELADIEYRYQVAEFLNLCYIIGQKN